MNELDNLPGWGLEFDFSSLTLEQLDKWAGDAFSRQAKIDKMEAELKTEKEARDEILETLKKALNHYHKEKYVSAFGNVEIRTRSSVRTPKTEEEKRAFFKWLEDKGVFWEYATINSNSLNSLVRTELEANPGIPVPGISDAIEFQQVILRKG